MKPSLPEIKRALLSIDDSVLSIDDLKAIARHLPTSEEVWFLAQVEPVRNDKLTLFQIKRIEEFGDAKQLAKADQYLKEV